MSNLRTLVRMVAAESVGLALLWLTMVVLHISALIVGFLDLDAMLQFVIGFTSYLFITHLLLNGWLVRIYWEKISRLRAVLLFVTFTFPLYLLLLRVRHAVAAFRGRNQVVARREALKARYAISVENSAVVEFPPLSAAVQRTSCVPLSVETSTNDSQGDCEVSLRSWVVTETNVDADSKLIKMSSDDVGLREPKSFSHLFMSDLSELVAGRKTLSFHFVLDANNDIIHVSKTSTLPNGLPDRVRNTSPLTICNDTHYLINLSQGIGYEVVAIAARNEKSCVTVTQTNLSSFLWCYTLYSTALLVYGLLVNLRHNGRATGLYHAGWMCTAAAWLLTCRGVDEPWTDTFAKIPLRLCFTVCRIFLMCGVAMGGLGNVAILYLSAKAAGYLALVGELVYKKLRRNVRPWGDVVDRYFFDKTLVMSYQGGESVVCCGWAIWCHVCRPSEHSFALLVAVLLCQAAGMIYLNFVRRFLKEPLKNPVRILMMAKDRMNAAEKSI
ncbi:uncharacterized protein LOC125030884 [Penaeus chinensis]|uniref:uncharacterized protein LOC125030884 n=1 Tax=Penaeus chinensis TaxID=139456 RepID=UPI001FB62464|nr:uncharacterized protein LOC125030884 [Penaeus chinensis]